MADLIDRGILIDHIMESDPDWCVKPIRPIFDFINGMPSADAIEVVRCKDCMLCQYDAIFKQYWCIGKPVKADDYCSMGVRKKDG